MIIECHYCKALVDGKMVGEYVSFDDVVGEPYRVCLLGCPSCNAPLVSIQEQQLEQVEDDEPENLWSSARRVWPLPSFQPSHLIPALIRDSLEEARKCIQVGAYRASAVMSGTAIEGMCVHFKTKDTNLSGGLRELLQTKVIDDRLFEWGEELRRHRNLGAHADVRGITARAAQDLLDFAVAICEYVFVLTEKFNEFTKRQQTAKNTQP